MLRDSLAAARPDRWRPDFAVDTTVWMRSDAECSPGRGFYYHPSRHSAGQPIVAGWCYSWLVALSAGHDSWTAPLESRRLGVGDNANQVAAQQVRGVLARLPALPMAALFAFDGGYDPVQLSVELAAPARRSWSESATTGPGSPVPFARDDGRSGRPRRHGARVACADPQTWPVPDAALDIDDEVYGRVRVSAWHRLHPKQRTYRDPGGALRIVEGALLH